MELHICKLTGDTFAEFKGVVIQREGKDVVRRFEYGDSNYALSILIQAVTEIGGRKRVRPVDVVVFDDSQMKSVIKIGLKNKTKVQVLAKKTDKGLVLENADDIVKVKSI